MYDKPYLKDEAVHQYCFNAGLALQVVDHQYVIIFTFFFQYYHGIYFWLYKSTKCHVQNTASVHTSYHFHRTCHVETHTYTTKSVVDIMRLTFATVWCTFGAQSQISTTEVISSSYL